MDVAVSAHPVNTKALPLPMVPAEVDLRGLEYMPLLGNHLFGSTFNASVTDREWRAAVTLWWAAWNQVPAGSLPDDDLALAKLAQLGRDLRAWRRLRCKALYGFVKCQDGRLYHEFLSKQAVIAWEKRVADRERKAKWRATRKPNVPVSETGTTPSERRGQRRLSLSPETGTAPYVTVSETGTNDTCPRLVTRPVPSDGNRRDGTGRDGTGIDTPESVSHTPERAPTSEDARAPDFDAKHSEPVGPGATPEQLAAELTRTGMPTRPEHPTVLRWADDGFSLDQLRHALAVARDRKGSAAKIAIAYVDPILRDPQKINGSRPNGEEPTKIVTHDQRERGELQRLMDRRPALGIADFRDPKPGESASTYRNAQNDECDERRARLARSRAAESSKGIA